MAPQDGFSCGGAVDLNTRVNYNIFRWYRSSLGRYTAPDPLVVLGDENPYLYAMGVPTSRIDPFGLYTLVGGTAGEKKRIDEAMKRLLEEMANDAVACGACKQYFQGLKQFNDISVWAKPGGPPYIAVVKTPRRWTARRQPLAMNTIPKAGCRRCAMRITPCRIRCMPTIPPTASRP